ncbi:hypothetical protein Pmani_018407 [Petrolisthes manimaculis]|uniref:Uncharacterized protein n=1 Tax=Petrolisthes manimaculis TaxID=1843537 RepID=A0AAE1PKF5_9EUCA|nr:hypothetical protein Pmani_018407 [Petrolisthes manimaculis]
MVVVTFWDGLCNDDSALGERVQAVIEVFRLRGKEAGSKKKLGLLSSLPSILPGWDPVASGTLGDCMTSSPLARNGPGDIQEEHRGVLDVS